jgi:hypothetical protein
MSISNSVKPLYIELYYSLILNQETPIPNYAITDYICPQPSNTFANIYSLFMSNENGKQNQNILSYIGFRSPGNSSLLLPPLFYEYLYILTPNNDSIQAFSNYIDSGTSIITTIPSEIFVVTATNGIFNGATIIKIEYSQDLTRKVIITNEAYMYLLPKELQIISLPAKESLSLTSDTPTELILYYSTILSKDVPINNASLLEITNLTPTKSYSVISNRYMQNQDGTNNENIITYLTYRVPGDPALELSPQINETLVIITPKGDKIQAVAVYTDFGVGEITTVPFQDFLVNGALGIFQGAKNVRVFYNNEDLTRKVVITNYYPNSKTENIPNNLITNIKNNLPISLYYAAIISPLVPVSNFTTTGFVVFSTSETYGGVNCRYMINENWVRNNNILTIFQTRVFADATLGLPSITCLCANIRTPEGDNINGSTIFRENTSLISSTTSFILVPVQSANGIFESAQTISVYRNIITGKVNAIIA